MPRLIQEEFSGQLKKVARLQLQKNRQRFGQFLVEGPQAVRELLDCAPELVRDLYVTERALVQHPDLDALAQRVDPYTHILRPQHFEALSQVAQGWLAVANIPAVPKVAVGRLSVALVQASDPGNLGTIIRSADAAGADAVFMGPESVQWHNPKVVRASAGSVFHLPLVTTSITDLIERAKARDVQVLAADARGKALGEVELNKPSMWLVGNEAHGFGPELEMVDHVVRLPMWGRAESLNAAVAASLCLFASAQAMAN